MGINLLLDVIAIEVGRDPDWQAAKRRIDALAFEDLDGYFAYWDPDSKDTAAEDPQFVDSLRAELLEMLEAVSGAFDGYHREITQFAFRGYNFFVTGGISAGEVPTSLYDPVSILTAVGVLQAAGFEPASVDVGSP